MTQVNEKELKKLDDIVHRIIFTSQSNSELFFNNGKKGLTTIEVTIIDLVSKYPDIILKDIISMLHIPNSTLTNAINRLEKKELVKRIISEKDKRSYGLQLTDKGKQAEELHIMYEKELFKRILSPLTTKEREDFIFILNKIMDNIE